MPSKPKPDEQAALNSLRASHPDFEGVKDWQRGNDPPDFTGTRPSGEKIGLELTEWLDSERATTSSISRTDAEYQWLEGLATEKWPAPKSFDRVVLQFKRSVKFNRHHATEFRDDFETLVKEADEKIDRSMLLQEVSNLSLYATLSRYVRRVFFEQLPEKYRSALGQRWVATGGRFYPNDPQKMARTFLETVERKISKRNYKGLIEREGLKELLLVVHFGIRGLLHLGPSVAVAPTTPLLGAVRSGLGSGAGPFAKVYLYLVLNDGPLYLIFPSAEATE